MTGVLRIDLKHSHRSHVTVTCPRSTWISAKRQLLYTELFDGYIHKVRVKHRYITAICSFLGNSSASEF